MRNLKEELDHNVPHNGTRLVINSNQVLHYIGNRKQYLSTYPRNLSAYIDNHRRLLSRRFLEPSIFVPKV